MAWKQLRKGPLILALYAGFLAAAVPGLGGGCAGAFCSSGSCAAGGAWFLLTGPGGAALADEPFHLEIEMEQGIATAVCMAEEISHALVFGAGIVDDTDEAAPIPILAIRIGAAQGELEQDGLVAESLRGKLNLCVDLALVVVAEKVDVRFLEGPQLDPSRRKAPSGCKESLVSDERECDLAPASVGAAHLKLKRRANPFELRQPGQLGHPMEDLVVGAKNELALLKASALRAGAGIDARHPHDRHPSRKGPRSRVLGAKAQVWVTEVPMLTHLVPKMLGHRGGDGEGQPLAVASNRRREADDPTITIDQGSTGVPHVDGRVGLDKGPMTLGVEIAGPTEVRVVTAKTGDHPYGHRIPERERLPNGHHPFTYLGWLFT